MPTMRFIALRCLVRKSITASLAAEEIAAKTSKGKPMPIPKNTNCSTFITKLVVDMVLVKRAAMKRGLHGTTMAPKKKPKVKALSQGFLVTGV